MNQALSNWQVEEIKKALAEADCGEFASVQELEQVME
jgi:predicted transcriptional regulator